MNETHGGSVVQQDEFEVWYETEKFPANFRRIDRMVFTVDALAHALFVTGRAPEDQARWGWTSVFEWLHRVALIPAYIRRAPSGRLMRSDLARELDGSEKVALSYTLGQGVAGIFSQHVVSVRFLMHVDRYAARHNLIFTTNSRQRADFFGEKRKGGWIVAEAKGRSGNIDEPLKKKMREQKRTIRSVHGGPPDLAYGCVAYFPQSKGTPGSLRVHAVDPIDDELESFELPVQRDRFILAYYEPFLAALEAGEQQRNQGNYRMASFGPFRLSVGILDAVAERVERARRGHLEGLHSDVIAQLDTLLDDDRPANRFPDGTSISTKWQDALGQDDWSEFGETFPYGSAFY